MVGAIDFDFCPRTEVVEHRLLRTSLLTAFTLGMFFPSSRTVRVSLRLPSVTRWAARVSIPAPWDQKGSPAPPGAIRRSPIMALTTCTLAFMARRLSRGSAGICSRVVVAGERSRARQPRRPGAGAASSLGRGRRAWRLIGAVATPPPQRHFGPPLCRGIGTGELVSKGHPELAPGHRQLSQARRSVRSCRGRRTSTGSPSTSTGTITILRTTMQRTASTRPGS